MTAAPPEPKQRLICETRTAAGGWPSGPEGADPEIARLRQRVERAEQETRLARGWAWMMFVLALTSGFAVSILAVRTADRTIDEPALQVLLRTVTDRQRAERIPASTPPAAPSLHAAPPKPTAVAVTPERSRSAKRALPAAAPRPSAPVHSPSAARPVTARPPLRPIRAKRPSPPRPTAPRLAAISSFSSFSTGNPGVSRPAAPGAAPQPRLGGEARRALTSMRPSRSIAVKARKVSRPRNSGTRRVSTAGSRRHHGTRPWSRTRGSSTRQAGWKPRAGSGSRRTGWTRSRPGATRGRWSWRSHRNSAYRRGSARYQPWKVRTTRTASVRSRSTRARMRL